ncbi:MAG: right-handed parallel beta-helix repeat-containing protein [Pseudomonadota bacterium]
MATINVANSSELMSALSSANAGDTILLASGNYGDVDFEGIKFNDYVTIASADGAKGAVFEDIDIENTSYLRLDGIHVDSGGGRSGIWISDSDHIDILNSEINGPEDAPYPIDDLNFGIEVRDGSHDIRIEGNDVHHVLNGIANFGTRDFEIVENNVNLIGADAYKFAGVKHGLIKNNTGPTEFHASDEAHADFMQFQGAPSSHLEISGNVLLLQNRFDMQGIFFGGKGGHNNLLIEENIVYTQMGNGISINEGDGSTITIQHNTVVNALSADFPVTRIKAPGGSTVEYNINSLKKGTLDGKNIEIQHTDTRGDFHYSDLFENAHTSRGITLEDLVPVEGSLAETYGAVNRLNELLNGTSSEPANDPAPEPELTPEPAPAPEPEPEPAPERQSEPAIEPISAESFEAREAPNKAQDAIFQLPGDVKLAGPDDVLEFAHTPNLEVDAATIALTFNADMVSGRQGLISKDASGYGEGGHFTAFIQNGTLIVRVQDETRAGSFEIDGIVASVDYDLQVSFGDGQVTAMLDGRVFGQDAFDMSWENNTEFLQIGANGWASGAGDSGFRHAFDGTISDVVIFEGVKSYDDVQWLQGHAPAPATPPASTAPSMPEFVFAGSQEISGADDVLEFEHSANLELASATIALSFNADVVSGRKGLFSKDANGNGDGGHFTAYIENGTLIVRVQNESGSETFEIDGIETDIDYDLQVSFGDGQVTAMINGKIFGQAEFDTSWENNTEFLQIGANGWASGAGDSGFRHIFDGTISDVIVAEGVKTYDEVQILQGRSTELASELERQEAPIIEPEFIYAGSYDISGANDVLEFEHMSGLELSQATIGLSFNADSVSGRQGLLSKDASGYGDGGHLTSYIDKGTLVVRVQNDAADQIFEFDGIEAGVDYDLQINFGNGQVSAILNGKVFGEAAFDMSWESNTEYMQIGANGWSSDAGEDGFRHIFDGTISDVAIFDEMFTQQEYDYFTA